MPDNALDTNFVINPALVLRTDVKRAVLFPADPVQSGKGPFTRFLHPKAAVFLSLFEGTRSLDAVIALWGRLLSLGDAQATDDAIAILESFKGLDEEVLVPRG